MRRKMSALIVVAVVTTGLIAAAQSAAPANLVDKVRVAIAARDFARADNL